MAASMASSSLPAWPTNGSPRSSSSAPGPSPTKEPVGLDVADAEHRLLALLAQAAIAAFGHGAASASQSIAAVAGDDAAWWH
jgi:hypothetical protein